MDRKEIRWESDRKRERMRERKWDRQREEERENGRESSQAESLLIIGEFPVVRVMKGSTRRMANKET